MPDDREELRQDRYDNVWDALEDTPELAAEMRLRSDLMISIKEEVISWGIPHAAAAERLNVPQSGLNDLLRGKITKFALDALVALAVRAGLYVRIEAGRAPASYE